MKLTHPIAVHLLLSCLAIAAPTFAPATYADYDAIVVGGGPAGLAATSGLARVRRNVLMVDSGVYRNDPTRHAHDVVGSDGVTPAWLRFSGRRQIEEYGTVSMVNGTVRGIQPEANSTYFTVAIDFPGDKPVTFTTRKVVLATGMRDIIPPTPGLREIWGQGLYWCPWCDGYEHADQSLGIIAALPSAVTSVREILTLNTDIVLLVNGTDTPENRAATDVKFPGWQKYLQLHNVTLENRIVQSVARLRNGATTSADPSDPTHPEHDLFQVNFAEGKPLVRNAFFSDFPSVQRSDVGERAGVQLYGSKLAANSSKGLETNVPGIFAIGDCNSDNITNVPHAFFSGKRTAVFLHVQLEREDSIAQVSQPSKRSLYDEDQIRAVWESMNDAEDITRSDRFDW